MNKDFNYEEFAENTSKMSAYIKRLENITVGEYPKQDNVIISTLTRVNTTRMLCNLLIQNCYMPWYESYDIYATNFGAIGMDIHFDDKYLYLEIKDDSYKYLYKENRSSNEVTKRTEYKKSDFNEVPKELIVILYKQKPVNVLENAKRNVEHALHELRILSDCAEINPYMVPDEIEDLIDNHYCVLNAFVKDAEDIINKIKEQTKQKK